MANEVTILPEPELEFRHAQRLHDPHDGLALFGPVDADSGSHPKNISYGVIGTKGGLEAFSKWAAILNTPILPASEKAGRLWPPYPGFSAAFHTTWPSVPPWMHEVDASKLSLAYRHKDPNQRAYDVVNLYLEGIRLARKKDEAFSLIACVVPDEVYANCRPESKVAGGVGKAISATERKLRASGHQDFFESYDTDQYQLSVDFRRQLKARAMEFGIPIQIFRESTLTLEGAEPRVRRDLTALSDRAWNQATALYYKAGGKPWRLSTARDGVCYIGIAFRQSDPCGKSKTACCAAQMFLDSGDGIVFLGEYGPWYSPDEHQFRLPRASAKKLLEGVLKTYEELDGRKLKEVFLHCRSDISTDEFRGYEEACPAGVKVVGVKVRREDHGIKLFRPGAFPVLRGTFWQVSPRLGYLWSAGFKPRIATYDGWETPVPLRIQVQHGEADIQQVAQDIFGLTKLNYNACRMGDAQPVTVKFSDAVGEILISNPKIEHRRPNFKFYI